MNPQNFRCMKMHMINNDKVELDGKLSNVLITQTKGLFAGGSSEKDLMDCPKIGQPPYEVCKDCQFSVPTNSDLLDV